YRKSNAHPKGRNQRNPRVNQQGSHLLASEVLQYSGSRQSKLPPYIYKDEMRKAVEKSPVPYEWINCIKYNRYRANYRDNHCQICTPKTGVMFACPLSSRNSVNSEH